MIQHNAAPAAEATNPEKQSNRERIDSIALKAVALAYRPGRQPAHVEERDGRQHVTMPLGEWDRVDPTAETPVLTSTPRTGVPKHRFVRVDEIGARPDDTGGFVIDKVTFEVAEPKGNSHIGANDSEADNPDFNNRLRVSVHAGMDGREPHIDVRSYHNANMRPAHPDDFLYDSLLENIDNTMALAVEQHVPPAEAEAE